MSGIKEKPTSRVRKEIPKILKEHPEGLTFNELFDELKTRIEDLVDDDGKDRVGVLQGIINKLKTIPVENMRVEKKGSTVYYFYVDGKLDELERVAKTFLDEVKNKSLLEYSILDFSKEDREHLKRYEELIIKLHELVYSE